jgi:glutathione S-transferase
MKLYFSPLACSMATRIALYEAGADAAFVRVDLATKRADDGADFGAVTPLGLVPALRTDDGELLTENAAILQYVADRSPQARMAPDDAAGRARLQQWLSFIGTELHKTVFSPLLDASAPDAARDYALKKSGPRLDVLERHIERHEHLVDEFGVADAYLVTVLNWTAVTPIDLTKWSATHAYAARVRTRPSVARAFAEESALYARARENARPATP